MITRQTRNARKAESLGNDRRALRKRLYDAKACFTDELFKQFGQGHFQFDHKRIVSDDYTLALVWTIREHPDEPINPENQQTSIGCVQLYGLNRKVVGL